MSGFTFEILQTGSVKSLDRILFQLKETVLIKKFDGALGIQLLGAFAIFLSLVVTYAGFSFAVVVVGAIIGIPLIFISLFNIRFGIFLIITLSFFLLGVKRITEGVPLGLAMDIIISTMFFGLMIKQIEERDWSFAKNPISKIILVWIVYNIVQAANPAAASRMAWLYTVRAMAGFMAMYFIILYAIDGIGFIRKLMFTWIFLASLAGLYGLYQEFAGFMQFEINWINADERRHRLIYIMGRYRKFSFLSDPAVFGMAMGYTSLLCFILVTGPFSKKIKVILMGLGSVMLLAMIFSGTRSAYVLPPAGFFFYSLLTFKRKVLIAAGVFFAFFIVIIMMPTGNPHIYRLQTAFKPTKDASYETRIRNQAFIQPFIQTHPFGGGLGSTGTWGKRFSPESPLANFPPDSGYVRIAVELGWIGLLIYCTMLFTIFCRGIKDYFRLKNPELKTYMLGMLTVLFTLTIASYPQEATVQVPTSLIFFVIIAIITKLKKYDTEVERARLN